MSLWACWTHGLTGPMACCPGASRVTDSGTTITTPPADRAPDAGEPVAYLVWDDENGRAAPVNPWMPRAKSDAEAYIARCNGVGRRFLLVPLYTHPAPARPGEPVANAEVAALKLARDVAWKDFTNQRTAYNWTRFTDARRAYEAITHPAPGGSDHA